ncbi:MAG: adenylate/guanylate cyclase domain-containing protein, partial [Vicinamibacteria bacterium]|nr:adenylate/guanylate cyclase domain-containing protein [Vicinamibacteria bacterium]
AGSAEFFQQTAQALVELVGLDCGVVLLRRDEEWTRVSEAGERSHADQELSRSILRSVLLRKQTSYRTFDANSLTGTHHSVDEVVAAPIFDAGDQVVGALYGTRDVTNAPGKGLGAIEAQVVQLLAAVAGTGLARQTQEADAARARVQFEQFFSPQLAAHLARDPQLLEAQEREITVLFTDMRGFSSLTEQLGPQAIYALMRDVMERIVAAVRAQEGVVVDYTGDGLLAMWNAPADQPDHAVRACRAALEMVAELPDVNQAWRERLAGGEIGLGVGINTGRALVGNTGTRHKFKYGPHGHTVNLGSRVEMATRQLGIPILISHTTHAALGGCFATRRLCRAHVAGIDAPVDLFELHGEEAATLWIARKANYEAALELFETRRFSEACRQIYPLLADPSGQEDIPSLTLIARAVECLKNPPHDFDPAIRIGKV